MAVVDESVIGMRVPKRTVPVELLLRGRKPVAVEVFLPAHQATSWHCAELLDLLENEKTFLPVRDGEHGPTQVVNKDAIDWVRVPHRPASGEVGEEVVFERSRQLRLEMCDGATLVGQVVYSLPEAHARVRDYLNTPSRFLRLWERSHVYLVSKRAVITVQEVARP